MIDNLKSAIWRLAAQRYGDELHAIVWGALSDYKLAPGYDRRSRIHFDMMYFLPNLEGNDADQVQELMSV
ncbi:hypothetical protein [Phytopseudomonas seleniipraecipitans]|uniref:hypothetical protein n=1 Tax=Phytopseudomonas seleniipraecipitans TaxID=640205 RepID=UPI000B87FF50|nr:hypothetical protein [Pseudomonas seleniipraecipitans]